MRVITSLLLLCACVLQSAAQQPPPEPTDAELIDPWKELQYLGSVNGVWEGHVEPLYDPIKSMTRLKPDGFGLRVNIRGESVRMEWIDDEGMPQPWCRESYIYTVEGTTMLNCINRNEAFVEHFSLFLAHVDKNSLQGYIARGVHNWTVRKTSPWRLIPVYFRVELERVG